MTVVIKILALFHLIGLLEEPSAFSKSNDLGVIGKQYEISEKDLLEEIYKNLTQKKTEIDQVNKELKQKSIDYANKPKGIVLPPATELKTLKIDPIITLQEDIKDASGKLLYAKGTNVNPLAYRKLTRTLCFLDADNKDQINWIIKNCKDPFKTKIILLNGEILKLSKRLKRRIYFDQGGYLAQRFGLSALPAIVFQSEDSLYVQQIPIH